MRKLFLFFCCILYSQLYSQKVYVFNVELNDKSNAPTFTQRGDVLVYSGSDPAEKAFFAKYTVHNFSATYANYSGYLLNVFTFVTSSATLMDDLKKQFPAKYLNTEDLTEDKLQLVSSYPNDFGNGVGYTNPVPNLGANISMKSFDYINVPKAWGFFPGSTPKGNVTIGISDGKVNTSDIDLSPSKVSYLHESSFTSTVFTCNSDSAHGTGVSAIAAAQGDNAHGFAGVCYDCNILNIPYTYDAGWPNYNGLMELALAGVRAINMSWIQGYVFNDPSYIGGYHQTQQDAINQLFEMGVVLVAGAGNQGSITAAAAPSYQVHCYPASYDHVISVTLVHAQNPNITDEIFQDDPVYGYHAHHIEDFISPVGGIGWDLSNPVYVPFNEWATTTNSRVDICGPGYAPRLPGLLLGCLEADGVTPALYASATSSATPFVTATAALMQSLNSCILPGEVEDVIQLTSKNLEIRPENSAFVGTSGSGKLETGDAVEFTSYMMSPTGVVVVDGQDFWRFDFNLRHIFNGMEIKNQRFRGVNTTNFTAKNFIDVTQNVDLVPTTGFVDLNIDSGLTVCASSSKMAGTHNAIENDAHQISKAATLYPNPNKGIFTIQLNQVEAKDVTVTIFDVIGKPVYETKVSQAEFELNISSLPAGMYVVRLSSNTINETLKFIKQ